MYDVTASDDVRRSSFNIYHKHIKERTHYKNCQTKTQNTLKKYIINYQSTYNYWVTEELSLVQLNTVRNHNNTVRIKIKQIILLKIKLHTIVTK